MKNLKRVLALVLVVTLVFSLSVSALAFTDDAAITHEQAVNVLSELGVIKGYPDGSYRPNDPVTRAEMAKMITVILNKGVDDPTQFESGQTDLTDIDWNWGKSYITYCYILNIIAGYGDGTFRPEDNVTVQEAAKMVLVALGFDVTQEGLEGVNWAVNANARANQYDIYTNVTQSVSEAATRDTIAQMLYNMLKANTVHYDVNIYTGISTLQKDEKALSKYFDCELLNGIVVANEYAALWGGVPLMEGRTEVLFYDEDATANGLFDIASSYYVNGVFNNWITDILKLSTGQDELGMWVSVIRNKTTKNVIGGVMSNDGLMTVVAGGDGNFLDAIKAASLRLSDGRYSLFVNGEILRWETGVELSYLPEDINHPLAEGTYYRYNSSYPYSSAYNVYNARLGTPILSIFGTEYKDMNGMTFSGIELNGDNYVDTIFVEAETLSQITKVETKGGAKEYTFADMNMSLNASSTWGIGTDDTDWVNYTAQSVKEAYIETDETLAVDDYVLVRQVNETYYVSKVVFEDMTVNAKATSSPKSLTLKDSGGTSTKYNLSNIPVVYAITSDTDLFTNDPSSTTLATNLVGNIVTGNKYSFGFDSAGNVVMAKKGDDKTDYALMNGVASTYGSSYTAQLFIEDGTTLTGGLGEFTLASGGAAADPAASRSTSNRASYLAGATDSASDFPVLVSYAEDGDDYDIAIQTNVNGATGTGNIFTGDTTIKINNTDYKVNSNTVFFYKTISSTGKVTYYAYTDYTKAPRFNNTDVRVQAATITVSGSQIAATANARLAAVFVQELAYGAVTSPSGQDYIYISRMDSVDYANKQTMVTGILIDKDGNVTETEKTFLLDATYTATGAANSIEGNLYPYTKTSVDGVYKLGAKVSPEIISAVDTTYMSYYSGDDSTYSSSATNIYNKISGGVKYEKLSGNFSRWLSVGDEIYVLNKANSTVAAFVMKTGNTDSIVSNDGGSTTIASSKSFFVYNKGTGDIVAVANASTFALTTGSMSTTPESNTDGTTSNTEAEAYADYTSLISGSFEYVTIDLRRTRTTHTWFSGRTTTTDVYNYVASGAVGPTLTKVTLGAAVNTTPTGSGAAGEYKFDTGDLSIDLSAATAVASTDVDVYTASSALLYSIDISAGTITPLTATSFSTTDSDTYTEFHQNGGTTSANAATYTYGILIQP